MSQRIFFSWQSDIRAAACRTLIQDALESAAKQLKADGTLAVELVIDRDTAGVAGSPDIGDTILAKIENADAFVADVTIVNAGKDVRPTPNPNVLVEVGFALKALGESRIILVQNVAFGPPEDLPFDLRRKRVTTFHSPADSTERASQRADLVGKFKSTLIPVLQQSKKSAAPLGLTLGYRKLPESDGKVHHYRLEVVATNHGSRRIDDWQVEFDFPTRALEPHVTVSARVAKQSNHERSLFRVDGRGLNTPIFPGEAVGPYGMGYLMNDDLFDHSEALFDFPVNARLLVDGEIAVQVSKPFRELQQF
jgi:hypothetical protein